MKSPEDVMHGFEKWKKGDGLVLIYREDLQKIVDEE
jgi:hypothetical protein